MQATDYGLRGRGADLFEELTGRFDFDGPDLAVLIDAARTLTLIDRLEEAAQDAPMTVMGSAKNVVINPVFSELRMQRTTFAALVNRLPLPEEDGGLVDMGTARTRAARKAARARWSKRGA